jgi:hypothetical protein
MQKRSLIVIIAATVIASLVVGALAISGTIYTWEKTFEVQEWKPEIECEIEVGDCRIVGCPAKVWVCLKLEDCCWGAWKDCEDWKEWKDECSCHMDYWECCCHVNGTYSVHLHWWNGTSEDWQYIMHLQEETNITLNCWKHVETYTFIPEWKGEYKVVVTFAIDSETYNFTNED